MGLWSALKEGWNTLKDMGEGEKLIAAAVDDLSKCGGLDSALKAKVDAAVAGFKELDEIRKRHEKLKGDEKTEHNKNVLGVAIDKTRDLALEALKLAADNASVPSELKTKCREAVEKQAKAAALLEGWASDQEKSDNK
jgi:hypothetical protein